MKQEVLKLDQRGAACEAEIGTDADIWYPTWYSPPVNNDALNPAATRALRKLKRKQGSKENDESTEISK